MNTPVDPKDRFREAWDFVKDPATAYAFTFMETCTYMYHWYRRETAINKRVKAAQQIKSAEKQLDNAQQNLDHFDIRLGFHKSLSNL